MITLREIEAAARKYADTREDLADVVRGLTEQIEQLKRAHVKQIRRHVATAAQAHAVLAELVGSAPDLFERPRTHTLHGIKLGYQKKPGRIEWTDAEQLLARIERQCSAEEIDLLIRVRREPDKDALAKLPAERLRKLGVTVVDAGDVIVIKPVDGEVDRLVDALLKGAVDEAQEA